MKARFEFAKKYKDKAAAWWNRQVHAYIDGKHFKVYFNGKERDRAAQHATWGAFRTPGKGLGGAYVKPSSKLAHNTGAASCLIMAGVGIGRVLMWHTVAKSRWSGQAAFNWVRSQLNTPLPVEYQLNTQLNTQLKTSGLWWEGFQRLKIIKSQKIQFFIF